MGSSSAYHSHVIQQYFRDRLRRSDEEYIKTIPADSDQRDRISAARALSSNPGNHSTSRTVKK